MYQYCQIAFGGGTVLYLTVEVNGAVCDPLRLRFYLISAEEISVNLSSNEFRELS